MHIKNWLYLNAFYKPSDSYRDMGSIEKDKKARLKKHRRERGAKEKTVSE